MNKLFFTLLFIVVLHNGNMQASGAPPTGLITSYSPTPAGANIETYLNNLLNWKEKEEERIQQPINPYLFSPYTRAPAESGLNERIEILLAWRKAEDQRKHLNTSFKSNSDNSNKNTRGIKALIPLSFLAFLVGFLCIDKYLWHYVLS